MGQAAGWSSDEFAVVAWDAPGCGQSSDRLYSARRGEFRVIYEIDEAANIVLVHRAQYRRSAYRRR